MTETTSNTSWKQPVPTVIPELENTPFLKTVFQLLILRCSNEDRWTQRPDGSPIHLKRGQCIVGRYEFAEALGHKREHAMRIERAFTRLISSNLMSKQKERNCSIVSINNYDQIVGMSKQTSKQRANSEQTVSTNKSDKSEKSAKKTGIARSLKDELPREKVELLASKYRITPERVEEEKQAFILWVKSFPTAKKTQNRSMASTVEAWIREKVTEGKIPQHKSFKEKLLEMGGAQ